MEKIGLINFLLMWIVLICGVACSCDMHIPHGDVTWWCATQDLMCPYSCHEGYKKDDTVSWLECSTSGQWVSFSSQRLHSTSDLCTPKPCPTIISKGAFSAACEAVVGSTCSFSCEAGYIRNTSVSEVTCQTSTEWSPDLRSLCLRPDGQQCPYYIPRGDLNLACIREPGQTCGFTCDEGYKPSISPSTIACGSNLKWNHNPASLCQEINCPKSFEGGYVSAICSTKYKATCSAYQCNPGYVKLARALYVECDESGKWINPTGTSSACVREDQLCPGKFPGGYIIWHCNRLPQESCTYYCYSGYLRNPSITWLTCQENRLWNVDTNKLCIQSGMSNTSSTIFRTTSPATTTSTASLFPTLLCDMQIPNGQITWWCATLGPPCPYSCHEGYKQDGTISWLNCSTYGQWVPWYAYQRDGVKFSIEDLCTRISNTSSTIIRTTSPAATTPTGSLFPTLLCDMQIPNGQISMWCATQGPPCPYSCHEGYKQHDTISWLNCSTSGQWVPLYPYQLDGVKFSIEDLCTHMSMSTFNESRSIGERSGYGNLGTIVGVTVGALTGIIIISFFVAWIAKRSSVRKSQRREPGHVGSRCLRPRENSDQNDTTLRQQPNADGIGSVSAFESPSYNGLYVHSFVQRIPTISSSCKYPGPPPSYSKTPIAHKESPPSYEEVVTDPSRFNVYI